MAITNDSVIALFDTLNRQSSALFRPKGGSSYLYAWDDESKKNDWRADGYRWRQNGTRTVKCTNGIQLTKTYFRVRKCISIYEEITLNTYHRSSVCTCCTFMAYHVRPWGPRWSASWAGPKLYAVLHSDDWPWGWGSGGVSTWGRIELSK